MWRYEHNSIRKEATEESDQKYSQIRKSCWCYGNERVRARTHNTSTRAKPTTGSKRESMNLKSGKERRGKKY